MLALSNHADWWHLAIWKIQNFRSLNPKPQFSCEKHNSWWSFVCKFGYFLVIQHFFVSAQLLVSKFFFQPSYCLWNVNEMNGKPATIRIRSFFLAHIDTFAEVYSIATRNRQCRWLWSIVNKCWVVFFFLFFYRCSSCTSIDRMKIKISVEIRRSNKRMNDRTIDSNKKMRTCS